MKNFIQLNEKEQRQIDGGLLLTVAGLYIGMKAGAAMAVSVGKAYGVAKATAAGIGIATGGAAGATVGWHLDTEWGPW